MCQVCAKSFTDYFTDVAGPTITASTDERTETQSSSHLPTVPQSAQDKFSSYSFLPSSPLGY